MKERKKVTLFTLYGEEEPKEILEALKEAGSEIEVIVCSGVLRPRNYFPFIKDEEGRPYYGREGIRFYLEKMAANYFNEK